MNQQLKTALTLGEDDRINSLLRVDISKMKMPELRQRLRDLRFLQPRASWPDDRYTLLKQSIEDCFNRINELKATFE